MRKKVKSLSAMLLLVLAVAVTGICFAATETTTERAVSMPEQTVRNETWEKITLEDTYGYGETLTIPARTVTVNGNTVAASSVVEFPDGTATAKTEIELTVCGLYTVRYTAVSGDDAYRDEHKFTVLAPAFRVANGDSTFRYGLYDSVAAGATKAVETRGLLVGLAASDTLTVGQLIDMRAATKNDTLIKAFATPSAVGRADFKKLVFTLTDALDPSVYLRIAGNHSPEGNDKTLTYYVAGGNGQVLSGYEVWWDRLHLDDGYGASADHTFTGRFPSPESETALDRMQMDLRYDADEVAVYVGSTLIIDLDDPKYFTTLWHGFPSGYARLTVTADSYTGSANAAFCLADIRGVDLQAETVEAIEPMITVDTEYQTMPEAKVGDRYTVPAARAEDYYCGKLDVQTSVYYNYASPEAVDVPVTDGKFDVAYKGWYAVVYRVVNAYGLTAERVLWIHAGADIPQITLSGAQIGTETTRTLGDWIAVDAIEATGGSGKLTVRKAVEFAGQSTDVDEGFRIERQGTYTVRITATDYLGQTASASFTVNAVPGDKPVFIDKPLFPHYLISGGTYTVPAYYANDYTSGTCERKLATVEIDGKAYAAGDTFVPEVAHNGDTVAVVFRCDGAEYPLNVETVKVFEENDGYLDLHMENYLVGESVAVTAYGDYIEVAADGATDGSWTFANTLLSENFDLQIAGEPDASYFDALVIRMIDAENPNVALTAKAYKRDGKIAVTVDGMQLTVSYGFESGRIVNFGFTGKSFSCNESRAEVSRCDNGAVFEGFPSGKIILSVGFENAVSGLASYRLNRVNGQPMSNGVEDRIAPKISIMDRDYGGCVSIGDTRVLPRAMASDTLDPACSFNMTVTAPDGTTVIDTSGKTLREVDPGVEYEIRFEQYGQYRVSYQAVDSFSGAYNRWSYLLIVEDEIAPEFEFATQFASTAKVGEAIAIPDFTVTDNITASEDIRVLRYVLNPDGALLKIPDGSNSIICSKIGVYEFRIMAFDAEGNVATIRVEVTVTQA